MNFFKRDKKNKIPTKFMWRTFLISSGLVCVLGGLIGGLAVYGAGLNPKSNTNTFSSSRDSILSVTSQTVKDEKVEVETAPKETSIIFQRTTNNRSKYNVVYGGKSIGNLEAPSTLSRETIFGTLRWANIESGNATLKQLYSTTNTIHIENGLVDSDYTNYSLNSTDSVTNNNLLAIIASGLNIVFDKNSQDASQLVLGKKIFLTSRAEISDSDLSFLSYSGSSLNYQTSLYSKNTFQDTQLISSQEFTFSSDEQELKFDLLIPVSSEIINGENSGEQKMAQNRIVIKKKLSSVSFQEKEYIIELEEIKRNEALPAGYEDRITLRNIPLNLSRLSILLKAGNAFQTIFLTNQTDALPLSFAGNNQDTIAYPIKYYKGAPNNIAILARTTGEATPPSGQIKTLNSKLASSNISSNFSNLEVTLGQDHRFFKFIISLSDNDKNELLDAGGDNKIRLKLTSDSANIFRDHGIILKYDNFQTPQEILTLAISGPTNNLSNVRLLEVKFS